MLDRCRHLYKGYHSASGRNSPNEKSDEIAQLWWPGEVLECHHCPSAAEQRKNRGAPNYRASVGPVAAVRQDPQCSWINDEHESSNQEERWQDHLLSVREHDGHRHIH